MTKQEIKLPWEKPGWLEEAAPWIHARLSEHGIKNIGPIEILHQRSWSTFAQIPTEEGIIYFKAPAPSSAYEAPVTEALSRWRPDCTVPVLAVDVDRGWTLTPDAGVTLRSLGRTPEQIDHWLKILPLAAALQLAMVDHVPELLAMGMPDRRLALFPQLFNELLEDHENLLIGLDQGLKPQEHKHLLSMRSQLADQCAQLAAIGFADTLTHEEIHEANVIYGSGRYIFTDWSDSSIAHPFFSILVVLTTTNHWLGLEKNGRDHLRIRDAYLEPWTQFATRNEVTAAFELAYPLAMVNRALSWQQGIGTLSRKHKEDYLDYVPGWLQEYLSAVK